MELIDKHGGGGSGGGYRWESNIDKTGSGTAGTSYSGGSGGGASNAHRAGNTSMGEDAEPNGGAGGDSGNLAWAGYNPTGGAGNPNGKNYGNSSDNSGTGGLLIIYTDILSGNGIIESNGSASDSIWSASGGGSGAGSINIFSNTISPELLLQAISPNCSGAGHGGNGGSGSITTGRIINDSYINN